MTSRSASLHAVVSVILGALVALLMVGAISLAYTASLQPSNVIGPTY